MLLQTKLRSFMSRSAAAIDHEVLLERTAELNAVTERIRQRKSLLVHGEQGVGKTRLLQEVAKKYKDALYVGKGHAPREFLLALIESLDKAGAPKENRRRNLQSLSMCSLKGVADRGLEDGKRFLIVDHVQSPSPTLSTMIKELNYYGRTPIIFAARSPHMEDIGLLRSVCTDKSERLELKNWPETVAAEFARRRADEVGLFAINLKTALDKIVEMSHGNPGAILQMVEMALLPQYRISDQIKVHILYLDFRMKGGPSKPVVKIAG